MQGVLHVQGEGKWELQKADENKFRKHWLEKTRDSPKEEVVYTIGDGETKTWNGNFIGPYFIYNFMLEAKVYIFLH